MATDVKPDEHNLQTPIPRDLHRQVRVRGAQLGRPVKSIVTEALYEWLAAHAADAAGVGSGEGTHAGAD